MAGGLARTRAEGCRHTHHNASVLSHDDPKVPRNLIDLRNGESGSQETTVTLSGLQIGKQVGCLEPEDGRIVVCCCASEFHVDRPGKDTHNIEC